MSGDITVKDVKEYAEVLLRHELPKQFTFTFGEVINDDDFNVAVLCHVTFEYGNCKHEHTLTIEWDAVEGVALSFGENPEYKSISKEVLMETFYYDLALKNLADEYLD